MTAIGRAPAQGCWLRSGASTGDAIVVSGSLGGSILGRHLDFEPRLQLAQELLELGIVKAATDISDGLGIDLLNVAVASKCGAELDLDMIPISEDAMRLSLKTGKPAIDHAVGDGEDFELLLAVSKDRIIDLPSSIAGVPLTRIGTFVGRTGLWSRTRSGVKQFAPKGYVHS